MSAGKDRRNMKKKQVNCLVAGAMLLMLCTGCRKPAVLYDSQGEIADTPATEAEAEKEQQEQKASSVCVYVCGEVRNPGVYELPADARLGDAVEAAGGMTEAAAQTYLNLAEHVLDGQKIEVLTQEEAAQREEEARNAASGLVNLNQASAEQLMTLTGIGESKAKDILRYREKKGSFSSVEELMEIPGIKAGVFQKIKDQITV